MTSTTFKHVSLSGRVGRLTAPALVSLIAALLLAGTAHASLTFDNFGLRMTDTPSQTVDEQGNPVFVLGTQYLNLDDFTTTQDRYPLFPEFGGFTRQAGSHPDFTTEISVPDNPNAVVEGQVSSGPDEAPHAIDVELPPGMIGNPNAIPECDPKDFAEPGAGQALCPLSTQVGVATVLAAGGTRILAGIYNLKHGPDVPARFGINYLGSIAYIDGRVRPGDYGITAGSASISQGLPIYAVKVTFWGVPADPSHDDFREGRFDINGPPISIPDVPRVPFLSAPTSCTDSPASFTVRGDSWEHRGVFDTRTASTDVDGTPFVFSGCERLPFNPSIDVRALSRVADAPSALNVDLKVPQSSEPGGLATAHVRKVAMTLPEGFTVSPSSAAGLGACSPAQIGLGTNDAPSCPDSSKLGTVTIDTPVLPDPLTGDIILASQNDNPFRSLIAMYLAVKGPGFSVKLPGKVDLDQATGQLKVTFETTPQLPFSRMQVELLSGSQAALATPAVCGTYNTHVEITSWASDTPVSLDSPTRIDQSCERKAFSPSFTAGTTNGAAGQFSPYTFSLTRPDGMGFFSGVEMGLPKGLLADIGSVPQCDAGAASAGACPAASRIGSTHVLSGPGAQPLPVKGDVYLTGPYKDAPFGLAIQVPTAGQAGPFDLGVITVRAGIYVDRQANVSVKSDPLPTIIQGIPLRMRQVNVTVDRAKFLFNPSSCAQQSVFGSFVSTAGERSDQTVAFQPNGCGDLDLNQKPSLNLTNKSQMTDGKHPGVDATVVDAGPGSDGANLKKVEVKLPLSLALDPDNAQGLCKPEQRVALACPKTSIVGQATAKSVLPHDLTGPVYFVEGLRKDPKSGRTIRTLPKLWIPLSGDGVTIDLDAGSAVDSTGRLATTFDTIPDAPIKQFRLRITGGKHGILVVSGKPGACDRDKTMATRFTGHNGQVKVGEVQAKIAGCKTKPTVKKTKTSKSKKALTVQIGGLGVGRVSLSADGLRSVTRTLTSAKTTQASITAKLTGKARASLLRHGTIALRLRVGYRPKGSKTAVATVKSVTLHR
ncbi:MAG: hypothetical protein ABW167_10500 [Baekduia sp.]